MYKLSCTLIILHFACAIGLAQSQSQSHPFAAQTQSTPSIARGMDNAQGEEIVGSPSGFSAVITLDDQRLQTLLQQGTAEIAIPPNLVNHVESVIIQRPIYFKDTKAKVFADARLSGQRLVVDVDQSVIDRIDYQPVELRVYEAGFSSVILKYRAIAKAATKAVATADPKTDSPTLSVRLRSGKGISGSIRGMKKLTIDSTLGVISIELARTNRIFVRKNGELNVELTNGDLISGKWEDSQIVLINQWGEETIELSSVSALIIGNASPLNNAQRVEDLSYRKEVNLNEYPYRWRAQSVDANNNYFWSNNEIR